MNLMSIVTIDSPTHVEWTIVARYFHRVWELTLPASYIESLFLGSASILLPLPFLFPNLKLLWWGVQTENLLITLPQSHFIVSLVYSDERNRAVLSKLSFMLSTAEAQVRQI